MRIISYLLTTSTSELGVEQVIPLQFQQAIFSSSFTLFHYLEIYLAGEGLDHPSRGESLMTMRRLSIIAHLLAFQVVATCSLDFFN